MTNITTLPAPPIQHEPLWSTEDVAEYLGLAPKTIRNMRSRDELPAAFVVGRTVRWEPADIRGWVKAQREVAA